MSQLDVLKIFNTIVIEEEEIVATPDLSLAERGIITNFTITNTYKKVLTKYFPPINITTLFTQEERNNNSPIELIVKQILHYIEVNGLDMPGLFNLTTTSGQIIKSIYVKGITIQELTTKIQTLLYSNAPIKDIDAIIAIIKNFQIEYDINSIQNNEVKVRLFDINNDIFSNGQDAVRYIVYLSTNSTLLIKSKQVIEKVKNNAQLVTTEFLNRHQTVLAQVFNRFKPIILALKNHDRTPIINKISRASKTAHIPVHESISKRFLSVALKEQDITKLISKLSLRDIFKILNLIEYKLLGFDIDAFIIRNGKVHIETDRTILPVGKLTEIKWKLVEYLSTKIQGLATKNILLDNAVHYGLPISRKQTLGNLPFGTTIVVEDKISSGIYWEKGWGAQDLDLSAINLNGHRVGWGQLSGYTKDQEITFSGDLVYPGGMEFLTSGPRAQHYGIFANIFNGNDDSKCELVVGTEGRDQWIQKVIVREQTTLTGRGSILGFVKGNTFTIYQGMLNNHVSTIHESNPILRKAATTSWTINKLLTEMGIAYDTTPVPGKHYDYDLSYSSFSIDKLEAMFF